MRYILISLLTLFGGSAMAAKPNPTLEAYFAGGCFWCMESEFQDSDGVSAVISGYMGGSKEDADYKKVSSGRTDHYEAVQVVYDPTKISYEKLLDIYWSNIDPLDAGGQFADRGRHYQTVIFVQNEQERQAAEASKEKVQQKFAPEKVATTIQDASPFYAAEEYHQDYYKKNSVHYNMYKYGSGRVSTLKKRWGDKK